ncbi:MAG: hypothetical protein KAY37_08555 [Phycisphaerae bacterium]|nr:hypothetical protein [Phycisphaerae bacterium]
MGFAAATPPATAQDFDYNITADGIVQSGFFGNYAVWREEGTAPLRCHLIYDNKTEAVALHPWTTPPAPVYDDEGQMVVESVYKLIYRLVEIENGVVSTVYPEVLLWDGSSVEAPYWCGEPCADDPSAVPYWRCYMPFSPDVVMDSHGDLHVVAAQYWCPSVPKRYCPNSIYVEHSQLFHLRVEVPANQPGEAAVVEWHQIHREKSPSSRGHYLRPNGSEHIMGPKIIYAQGSYPNNEFLFVTWSQHNRNDGHGTPHGTCDKDDHDIFFQRATRDPVSESWEWAVGVDDPPIVIGTVDENPLTDYDAHDEVNARALFRPGGPGEDDEIWVVWQRRLRMQPEVDIRYSKSTDLGQTWSSWTRPDGDGFPLTAEGTEELGYLCPSLGLDPNNKINVCCLYGPPNEYQQIKIYKWQDGPGRWREPDYSPVLPVGDAAPGLLLYPYFGCYPSFRILGADEFSIVYESQRHRLSHPDVVQVVYRLAGDTIGPTPLYTAEQCSGYAARWVVHHIDEALEVFWCWMQDDIDTGEVIYESDIVYKHEPLPGRFRIEAGLKPLR